ncbi:MAG: GAF domain-containing protein [Chloroflexi bacterium]|nr:GAF domain-containing protein [Chloroflexota bacterium]
MLEHVVRLIPCEWASIILHDEALTEETIFASQHMPDIQVSPVRTQPVVPNQVLERLKSGRTAIAPDLGLQEGPLAHLAADLLAQGVRAAMANPMMVQGRLIGTLALAARQVGFFTPEHQQIAEEIASQVAIAFYQAELNDKIARHTVELERRVQERTALLESANHDLELFSYSVSHDLRAPLRAIQGFSEIISRRHRAALNDEGRRYFENIIVASSQMDQLITDLLSYSRLGRQRVPHMRPVSLDSVLSDVMIDLTAHILEADARIEVAQSLPSVDGDRTLLKQVFTNLIQNALTYHRQGVPPHIRVSSITEDEHVAIRVIDNGIGIPPEFRERIFGLFQRLHSQEEYPGTGIGLAVVRKAVEMMSGDVWVEAAPEQGSVFCVRLQRVAEGEKP